MNIHSVMPLNAVARRSDPPPGPKRDAILRAAIDVFAERGFFNAQVADGQREGLFRADVKATAMAKMLFGALDEMATNWILSTRKYSLVSQADAIVDLFVGGVARAPRRPARRRP